MKLLALLVGVAVAAVAAPASADVSGTYQSTFGRVDLRQDGDDVQGTYGQRGGHLHGTLDGTTISLTWWDDAGSGRGTLTTMPDGRLLGTWGHVDDEENGGALELVPLDRAAVATFAAPATSAWSHWYAADVRVPWDVLFAPDGRHVAEGGVGVDLGRHVSEHWYSGLSADYTRLAGFGADRAQLIGRERAGGELRWYFVGTSAWLGYRVGVEHLDGDGDDLFVEGELGVDWRIGRARVGMYVSYGDSVPKPSADSSSSAPPPHLVSDLGIGLRIGV